MVVSSDVRTALRHAEEGVRRLVDRYQDHGCAVEEIEAMASVVAARAEVEFQHYRLRREAVRRHLVGSPQAFGRALHRAVWAPSVLALLPGGGWDYGWNDGGCLLLSDALADLLGERVEQVAIVGNATMAGQHFLVRFTGSHLATATWYLDADGACGEAALLRRWEREGVHTSRVTRISAVDIEAPRDRAVSRRIARHLVEALHADLS